MSAAHDLPMAFGYRTALVLAAGLGLLAAVLCGLELAGAVEPGTLLGETGPAETAAGLVVGLLLLPFSLTALRHGRLTLDATELRVLRFGFLCRTEAIPLRSISRFGDGVVRRQGRHEHFLLLDLQGGTTRSVKISMFRGGKQLPAALAAALARPAAPTKVTLTGLKFDDAS